MAQSTPDMYVGLGKEIDKLLASVEITLNGVDGLKQAIHFLEELTEKYGEVQYAIGMLDAKIKGLKTQKIIKEYTDRRDELKIRSDRLKKLIDNFYIHR